MATERSKGVTPKGQADTYNEISGDFQLVDGIKLMELTSFEEGSRVLDLGCGTGRLTAVLAGRLGSKGHVVGIDPDEERLITAREKNSRANITYFKADGETFPKGPYDLVLCNYVLHWIEDKEAVFNRVHANLHPGGQFAFLTGLDKSPFVVEATTLFQPTKQKELSQNIFFVPLDKLEELAAASGFGVSYKELGANHRLFRTVEAALEFLYASSNGSFDSSLANKEALEMLKKKYSNQKVEISTPIVYMILTKP